MHTYTISLVIAIPSLITWTACNGPVPICQDESCKIDYVIITRLRSCAATARLPPYVIITWRVYTRVSSYIVILYRPSFQSLSFNYYYTAYGNDAIASFYRRFYRRRTQSDGWLSSIWNGAYRQILRGDGFNSVARHVSNLAQWVIKERMAITKEIVYVMYTALAGLDS
jgi:hypothetical protein